MAKTLKATEETVQDVTLDKTEESKNTTIRELPQQMWCKNNRKSRSLHSNS